MVPPAAFVALEDTFVGFSPPIICLPTLSAAAAVVAEFGQNGPIRHG